MKPFLTIICVVAISGVLMSCGGGSGTGFGPVSRQVNEPPSGGAHPENYVYDPPYRSYTDPISHQTYDIVDGSIIIKVRNMADPDFSRKWAAFVAKTRIREDGRILSLGAVYATLPHDVTVEYAVANWPQLYPDIIEAVYPDDLMETF